MKKISKKTIISENIYESNNGKTYPYEGLAVEQDIKEIEQHLADIENVLIDTPKLNLYGTAYRITEPNELNIITQYCELKDFSTEGFKIPMTVIITDNMALNVNNLIESLQEIAK